MEKIKLHFCILLIKISNLFYKLSRIFCACFLNPRGLSELTKYSYRLPGYIKSCYNQEYTCSGLENNENYFAQRYINKTSSVLVAGCGGGRECLALAKLGLNVTGIDIIEDCIGACRKNASRENLTIEFKTGDVTDLRFLSGSSFDSIMLPALLYSLIPSSKKRIEALRNISAHLKPGGKIFLNFLCLRNFNAKSQKLKKIIALITLGNNSLEYGDSVEGDGEFKHYFSREQIENELKESYLKLEELNLNDTYNSFAVLSKHSDFTKNTLYISPDTPEKKV